MKKLVKVLELQKMSQSYRLVFEQGLIDILFLQESVIRIRASFNHDLKKEASYILRQTAWNDTLDDYFGTERERLEVINTHLEWLEGGAMIHSNDLTLSIQNEPFSLTIHDKEGTLLHKDLPGRAFTQDHLGQVSHYQVTNRLLDGYYGFGEQSGSLNKVGKRMRFCSKDNIGYDSKESSCLYKHIPFFIKIEGIDRKAMGYFYHNTYESYFDAANEMSGYWSTYPGSQYSHFRAEEGEIDLFFIAGPKLSDVVERYTDLTGKSALMPRYALGYLGSTMYYSELEENCDQHILQFIEKTKKEDLPIDAFFLSSGYTLAEGKRYVFTWNKQRFSDPSSFFKAMEKLGVMVSANIKPGILTTHPSFEEWSKAGFFIKDSTGKDICYDRWWGGTGAFFDFTKPEVREEWKNLIKQNLLNYGCQAIWNDNNEYDSIEDKESQCCYDGLGGTIGQLKPIMATLMAKSSYEALQEAYPNLRPYVTSRAGSAGIQRYAQTWAGDNLSEWKSVSYNLSTLLNLGISGLSHVGCDVGGFFGPAPSAMMFLRWVQSGIFYPRFSIHSANTDNTVTEPWMYQQVLPAIRQAIALRYSLMPYFYSLNYESYRTGQPILRAMIYEFQEQVVFANEHTQFMLGKALLVAPVVEEKATHRRIILPAGEGWYSLETGEREEGGKDLIIPVDKNSIPMWLRSGEFLCLSHNKVKNTQEGITDMVIYHAPEKEGHFTLYEDDGISTDYKKGCYRSTEIQAQVKDKSVSYHFSINGNYSSSLKILQLHVFYSLKAPLEITLAGKKLIQYLDSDQFSNIDIGWHYEHTNKSIQIKWPLSTDKKWSLDINFGMFDLIGN